MAGAVGDGDAGVDTAFARTQGSVMGGVAELDAGGGNENSAQTGGYGMMGVTQLDFAGGNAAM